MFKYPSNRLFPPWLNAQAAIGARSHGPAVICLRLLIASRGNPGNPLVLSESRFDDSLVEAVRQFQICIPGILMLDVDGNFGRKTRQAFAADRGVDVETIPANVFGVDLGTTCWAGPHHYGLLPWPLDERTIGKPCPACERSDAYMHITDDPYLPHHLCVSCGYVEQTGSRRYT